MSICVFVIIFSEEETIVRSSGILPFFSINKIGSRVLLYIWDWHLHSLTISGISPAQFLKKNGCSPSFSIWKWR